MIQPVRRYEVFYRGARLTASGGTDNHLMLIIWLGLDLVGGLTPPQPGQVNNAKLK